MSNIPYDYFSINQSKLQEKLKLKTYEHFSSQGRINKSRKSALGRMTVCNKWKHDFVKWLLAQLKCGRIEYLFRRRVRAYY